MWRTPPCPMSAVSRCSPRCLWNCCCGRAGRRGSTSSGLIVLGLLAAVPISQIAVTLIDRWVTGALGPRHLPRLELAGSVPRGLTHVRRGAHHPARRGGRGLERAATGSAFPGQFRRRCSLCSAQRRRGRRPGRNCPRTQAWWPRRPPGSTELNQPLWTGDRRGHALLPVPPAQAVEPDSRQVDRLGTQARQAARVQSSAAWRAGHLVPGRGRQAAPGACARAATW